MADALSQGLEEGYKQGLVTLPVREAVQRDSDPH